jgi:hypothetical protein
MNTALIVPDGKGVRNFVLGRPLRQISEAGHCLVLHVIPDDLLQRYQLNLNGRVSWMPLGTYRERMVPFMLRHSLGYAQMCWADTQAMRFNREKRVKGSWKTRAAHEAARRVGRVAASPGGLRLLDRWHCQVLSRASEVEYYRQLFRRTKPAVLLCSHQRPPSVLPPVLAARSLGIPTATFIFSWDNLTSKGRIAAPFDHYLVWSEHMRQELLRYYPDIPADRAHIVGTPQFEPHADRSLIWSRREFFERIGADPSRPLICHSGGDAGNYSDEQSHARVLLEAIRSGRIRRNPQVLLRPAPVDDGSRYDGVRRDYPELIYARPAWVHTSPGDWSRVIPLPEDVQFLANVTHHADLNLSVASTMTLDFAIHDKPIVNAAFDVAVPPPLGRPLWEHYYQFEHYKPVVDIGAARFARSPDELVDHINAYLDNPALEREQRRRLVSLQIGAPLDESTPRILQVLAGIAR